MSTNTKPRSSPKVTDKEAAALRKDPNVARVEDDGLMYAFPVGYDTAALLFENQPIVQAETVPAGVNQIKAPLAWDATRGKGVKVAVLDTGIDFNHPDLAANYRGGVSFVPDETNPMDYNRHGSHCAGIIAAALNGVGVVGVAPAAYLYAVKVLSRSGSGNWSWLIAGLDWCMSNGIHVASMSLGGTAPSAVQTMCDLAFAGRASGGGRGQQRGPVEHPARYGASSRCPRSMRPTCWRRSAVAVRRSSCARRAFRCFRRCRAAATRGSVARAWPARMSRARLRSPGARTASRRRASG